MGVSLSTKRRRTTGVTALVLACSRNSSREVPLTSHRAFKAASCAEVAGCPNLVNVQKQNISITVELNLTHVLGVTTGVAFTPIFGAGA
jgi:hypothetical protein